MYIKKNLLQYIHGNQSWKYKGAILRSRTADQNHTLRTTAKVGLFL